VGSRVTGWNPGDRVFGITGGGAHAQFVATEPSTLAPIPTGLSWTDAAAIPEAFITAHDALCTQGGLARGEFVLIHAVASGVGLAAAQLGHALAAQVFGTSRHVDKLERARAFGMAQGYLAGEDLATLGAAALAFTAGHGFDLTLDLLGGPYLPASAACAAGEGRIMLVGAIAGAQSTIDVRQILGKRLTLRGTVLRSRSVAEKAAVTAAFARDVIPLLVTGAVRPVVDRVFGLRELAEAHAYVESNASFGKTVIEVP
jgi:NADPH:quinone reductase-like Zn-dependent oxidoreductase